MESVIHGLPHLFSWRGVLVLGAVIDWPLIYFRGYSYIVSLPDLPNGQSTFAGLIENWVPVLLPFLIVWAMAFVLTDKYFLRLRLDVARPVCGQSGGSVHDATTLSCSHCHSDWREVGIKVPLTSNPGRADTGSRAAFILGCLIALVVLLLMIALESLR